jgi:hypothetical protein
MSITTFTRSAAVVGTAAAALVLVASPTAGGAAARSVSPRDAAGPAIASQTWESVAPMPYAHGHHAVVTLRSGSVMVIGGKNRFGTETAKVEIYNPTTQTWRTAAPMNVPRSHLVAVRLRDGRVLVAGGGSRRYTAQASAEIFDPATQVWTMTGRMSQVRTEFDGIVLPSGKVLVVGGWNSPSTALARRSAEIYDPATESWTPTGKMLKSRAGENLLASLPDGRVLVAGGIDSDAGYRGITESEIYDPDAGTWTRTDDMSYPRGQTGPHVTLNDGRVMVAGGTDGIDYTVASVDLFDPVTETWSAAAPMHVARQDPATITLPDGRVLVAGGCNSDTLANLRSAELYDPVSDRWTYVGSLPQPATGPGAALLPDGRVLVAGGLLIPNRLEGLHLAAVYTP